MNVAFNRDEEIDGQTMRTPIGDVEYLHAFFKVSTI